MHCMYIEWFFLVQNIHLNFPRHSHIQVILPRNSSKAVKTSGDIMQYVVNMFPDNDVHSVVQKGSSGNITTKSKILSR